MNDSQCGAFERYKQEIAEWALAVLAAVVLAAAVRAVVSAVTAWVVFGSRL